MISFRPGIPFVFNYPTFDLLSGLFVRASIFDCSTGTPVLVTTVPMPETQSGIYTGSFSGISLKSYLIISLVYTDGTYSTIDLSRAPEAECYKATDAPIGFFSFNYGVFDQNAGLFLGANIYDCTSGTPAFDEQIVMTEILGGVYFGVFTGLVDHSYNNFKFVYQDIGLTTIDTTYSPDVDIFEIFSSAYPIFQAVKLQGQSTQAILKESI